LSQQLHIPRDLGTQRFLSNMGFHKILEGLVGPLRGIKYSAFVRIEASLPRKIF